MYATLLVFITWLMTPQVSGLLRGDFDLVFPANPTHSPTGVLSKAFIPDLSRLSFCVWLNADFPQGKLKGTVFSYYNDSGSSIQLYSASSGPYVNLHGTWLTTISANLNDEKWRHFCVTIDMLSGKVGIYADGVAQRTFSQAKGILRGGGCLVIGQDQGSRCGSFSGPYYGSLSQLNLWNRVLSEEDVYDVYRRCPSQTGNVFAWARQSIVPQVKAPVNSTETTAACENNYAEGTFTRTPNMALLGHVISSHHVASEFGCASRCLHHPDCQSFNLRLNGVDRQLCELLRENKAGSPASFSSVQGAVYCEGIH